MDDAKYRLGRLLQYDAAAEKCVGDDETNKLSRATTASRTSCRK